MARTPKPPLPKVRIRALAAKGLPEVVDLWSRTKGIELAEGDSLPNLRGFLRRNPGTSHVAIGEGKVVGALLAGHDGRRGFLYHLAVGPSCRRAGIGKMLVVCSLAALRSKGIARVLLLVSRANKPGIEFWEKQGREVLTFASPLGKNHD